MSRLHLVLGGARSGKSRFAETLAREAERQGHEIVLLATALAGDAEMAERIARHKAARPAHWRLHEVGPTQTLAGTLLQAASAPRGFVVVDCLTLWLSQLMCPPPGLPVADVQTESAALLRALPQLQAPAVLVSNEIGQGVVPMVAGLPVAVKDSPR